MAVYEGITYSRQDSFDVEPELRSGQFELEQGDSAAKIAYYLCSESSLIGEFVISEEGKAEILQEACRIFRLLCAGKIDCLPLTDGRVLAVACVLLTRNHIHDAASENETESNKLWQTIFDGLHFSEIAQKTGCSEQVARRYLCDVLKDPYNVRFFTDGGKKYFNTLRLHALSPEWSILNLYHVLYGFYHKNLECSYYTGTDVASMFVSGLSRRWQKTGKSAASQQNIQSDQLSSSLRELFIRCPNYMAAVCDALLERIDRIVQGDLTLLDDKNRWDVLLREWYLSKTAYEKSQMTDQRKAAVRRLVVDRKENIRPEYVYDNKIIYLQIPGIRLPKIEEAPYVELYQNDQLILRQRLSIYGNDVLWSTRACRIPLDQTPGVNWKKRFLFRLRIVSGQEEIYHSDSALFREYLCFTPGGNESRLIRCGQMLRLIVRKSAKLIIDDPEDHYTEEAAPYRSIGLWTESVNRITLNGSDILEDSQSGPQRLWAYMTPEPDSAVCARFGEEAVSVYDSQPILHVVLPNQTDAKNYQVTIDDVTSQLYQYPWSNGQFRIPLPPLMERKHTVVVKDFDSGRILFQRSYTIVPGLSCEFNRPFYLDNEFEGKLFIRGERRNMTHRFTLHPGDNKVTWEMAGLTYEIAVPKVYAEISEKNAFSLSKNTWYEELKDSFLTIRKPENVSCAVVFDCKLLAPNHTGSYEVGVEIENRTPSPEKALLGISLSCNGWNLEWKLTNICFTESFRSNPVIQNGRQILWDPTEAGFFGGEANPEFRLELENDLQEEPFRYTLRMKPDLLERNFPCRTGDYRYVLWLVKEKKLLLAPQEVRLLSGVIHVEDPPEQRFDQKHIQLTHAYFSDPITGADVYAAMKPDCAVIDDIRYEGIRDVDGEARHEYSGLMFFRTVAGWKRFSDEETDRFEKINPVFFTLEQDDTISVYLEEDETLMLNTKWSTHGHHHGGVQIFSRKDELSQQEQARYLAFASKFRYTEGDN